MPEALHITLLGTPSLMLDGASVTGFVSSKAQALVYYLAATGQAHTREALAGLLWSDVPDSSARKNLRDVLSNLRRLIGPYLLITRQTVSFNSELTYIVDSERLITILSGFQRDASSGPEDLAALSAAVDLYQGEFLAGFYVPDAPLFEEWTLDERERLRRALEAALEMLVEGHSTQGEYQTAIGYAQRWLSLDPLREAAHRTLMELYAWSGDRAAALRQYQDCVQVLQSELEVEPSPETVQLCERIRAGEVVAGVPARRERMIRGYEIRERIGTGGFGVVYRAFQPQVGREVVIKAILPQFANRPEFIRRFETEAQLVARLEHPYIVPLYDFWRGPDGAYLVMRWLRGGSLKAVLERGPWKVEAATRLVGQIAEALATAHRQGVVHRDIKPANILLDEEGNAYLSDFGIAKHLDGAVDLTQSDALSVSPDYISPEQVQSEPATPLSDIYCLGVVVYELLTGEHPFPNQPFAALLVKHLSEPLPSALVLRPELPPAVDEVIQRATAKDPSDRFPDPLALAGALRQALTLGRRPSTRSGGAPGEAVEAVVAPPLALASLPEPANPYKGLRPFLEADAADFFGREALTKGLLKRLAPSSDLGEGWGGGRFLAVVGPSGSGKSSVVRAGLIPALRQGTLPGSENWFVVEMFPGAYPLEELEAALLRIAVNPPPTLMEQLRKDERGLLRAVKRVLPTDEGDQRRSELVLVIDQFEELFTLVKEEGARAHFTDSLCTALADPRGRLRVIVTLRADFYDRPLLYRDFGELVRTQMETVLPLSAEELERAISGPAERVGVALEQSLAAEIVADVIDQPGALPLLQYALTELFERRDGHILTLAAYHAIGGVLGALGRRAEELYQGFDAQGQEATRQLFLRLITLGEGVEDTRRRVLRAELLAMQATRVLEQVIDLYGHYRLLTFDRDPVTRGPTVEVAHEALLREWERLRDWLESGREDVRMQRRLAAAAAEWDAAGRDPSYLLRGTRLAAFEGWAAESAVALTQDERAYLEDGLAARRARQAEEAKRQRQELETARKLAATEEARAEEQARAARRLRWRALFLAVTLLIAIVLAALASLQWRRADQQRQSARDAQATAAVERDRADTQAQIAFSRQLAAESLSLLDGQLDLAFLLSVEAYRSADTFEARNSLLTALSYNPRLITFLHGHSERVERVLFSPDGQTLATAGCVEFKPVSGACDESEIFLWDVRDAGAESKNAATGAIKGRLIDHSGVVLGLTFSPDGKTLASGSFGGRSIILWDVRDADTQSSAVAGDAPALRQFLGQPLTFTHALGEMTFLPDDQALAAITAQDFIIWDLSDAGAEPTRVAVRRPPIPPAGDLTGRMITAINSLALTPHAKILAVGTCPANAGAGCGPGAIEIVLWDVATGQFLGPPLTGDIEPVYSVALSLDGRTLASGSADGTIVVWDVITGQPIGTPLNSDLGLVRSMAFSPDGGVLASGGCIGVGELDQSPYCDQIRVWDVATGLGDPHLGPLLAGHQGNVRSLAFSPDGRTLASAGDDRRIILWDAMAHPATGRLGRPFSEHPRSVNSVAFSPDGQVLIAGNCETVLPQSAICQQAAIHLWDVTTGRPRGQIEVQGLLSNFAFRPQDQTLAVVSCENTACERSEIRLWDVTLGEPFGPRLTGHSGRVSSLAFSPDGQMLAAGDGEGAVILWNVSTETALGRVGRPLAGHAQAVEHVTFGPDGGMLASSDRDSIILWDLETGQPLGLPLTGDVASVHNVAFSPDGRTLASWSGESTIIVSDVATGQPITQFDVSTSHAVRKLTGLSDYAWSLAFSPDGGVLALGLGKTISLWDVATGQRLGPPLAGQQGNVRSVAFSPDGRTLVSGSDGNSDDTIMLWDVSVASWQARACRRANRNLTQAEWGQFFEDQPYRKTCPDLP